MCELTVFILLSGESVLLVKKCFNNFKKKEAGIYLLP